jgi:N-acetyltransferase 10
LKLIAQLREQSASGVSGRTLHEIELKDPVRYSKGDPVEKWLNQLLCLDASVVQKIPSGFPHPKDCELYYVNRDTLFSYHKASEAFLQRLVALFVSSHYKNSPNDLMLMSDAPAHHIFVLLGPVDDKQKNLPEILCAIQVSLEGQISKEAYMKSMESGKAPDGDLIPWTLSQQFQDKDFPSLSGGRVVRIATHPDYQKMGYGSRSLELLASYYQGDIVNLDEAMQEVQPQPAKE